jgi:hypothetical protein
MLFPDYMIVYGDNPKEISVKLLKSSSQFSEYTINMSKSKFIP